MYNKEELEKKTRDELRKIAKDLKIKKWYEITKNELVESIIFESNVFESVEKNSNENANKEKDEKRSMCRIDNKKEDKSFEVKMKYLKNIQKGTIVAFRTTVMGNVRYKSAAVENYNQSKKILKLVTSYGAIYIIPFSDVIWVRTNSRWPKGVYELLKGVKRNEGKVE